MHQDFELLSMTILVAVSMALSAILIWLTKPLMVRYATAMPNARSSHLLPTPQGAGFAVMAATLLTACAAIAMISGAAPIGTIVALAAALVALAVVGAADDVFGVAVVPRLAIQFAATALAIFMLPPDMRLTAQVPLILERALLTFGCVWFVNLTNFMDGLDWITAAEVIPVCAGLIVAGALDALPPYAVALALALFGATLGFAPFNRPVARVFLGDVGSLPLGLLLSWLLVQLAGGGYVAAAILFPLYYVADATLTLMHRLTRAERVWQAHRSHFYQRATAQGMSVLHVVGTVFATNILLGALGCLTIVSPNRTTEILAVAAGCIVVATLLRHFHRGGR